MSEDLTIPQIFHKLRNTYQVLYSYLGTPEEESLFTPKQVMEYLERDLKLMLEAEKNYKTCKCKR